MKLPLTLAIIDGILVRVGDRDFVIPTVSVVESMRPERSAYNSVKIIMTTALGSFHPEMALFRNLGVNLRDRLCGVPMYASAQSLDFLDLAKNC